MEGERFQIRGLDHFMGPVRLPLYPPDIRVEALLRRGVMNRICITILESVLLQEFRETTSSVSPERKRRKGRRRESMTERTIRMIPQVP
jgi:hypothetical protein